MYFILTTYPNKPRDLKRFILGMVKSKLAACVQRIQYVKSYYIWEDKFEQNEEKILIIKGDDKNKEKIIQYIQKNHPYDVPEIISLKPDEVNEAYLNWVKGGVK
ncbi:MAG: divalent-cation tolerance protein CutA [bacterium]